MQNFQGIVFIETQKYGEIFKFALVYLQKILTSKVIANFLMDLLHDFQTHPWRTIFLLDTPRGACPRLDIFPKNTPLMDISLTRHIPGIYFPDGYFPDQANCRWTLPPGYIFSYFLLKVL